MSKKLTPKQEMFIQELISGKSQYEAYLAAYPASQNWTNRKMIDNKASNLMKKPHILERYNELKQEYIEHVTQQTFYNRDCLLADFMFLKDEAKESIEQYGVRQANSNAYINALKNIGELLDLYPDKRLDITASVSNDFEINIFNDGDTDETED